MLRLFTELSDPIKLTLATALAQGQKSRAEKLTHTHPRTGPAPHACLASGLVQYIPWQHPLEELPQWGWKHSGKVVDCQRE